MSAPRNARDDADVSSRFFILLADVTKGWHSGWKLPCFLLVLEYFQLWTVCLAPDVPWGVQDQHAVLRYVSGDISHLLSLTVSYILMGVVVAALAAFYTFMWVLSWQTQTETLGYYTKKGLRMAVVALTTVLSVPLAHVLISPADCFASGGEKGGQVHHVYTGVPCWEWPQVIGAVTGIMVVLALIPCLALMDLMLVDARIRNGTMLSRPLSRVHAVFLGCKIGLVVVFRATDVNGSMRGALLAVVSAFLFFVHLYKLPFYSAKSNIIACGFLAMAAAGGAVTCAVFLLNDPSNPLPFQILLISAVPAFIAGAVATLLRLRSLKRRTMEYLEGSDLQVQVEEEDDVKGGDEMDDNLDESDDEEHFLEKRLFRHVDDVEICCRFVASEAASRKDAYPRLVRLCKAGTKVFPKAAQVWAHMANVTISFKRDGVLAALQLKRAKRLPHQPDLAVIIALHELSIRSLLRENSMDQEMDTLSFLEFQSGFKTAKTHHADTLRHLKKFWSLLSSSDSNIAQIPTVVQQIAQSERLASAAYEELLKKRSDHRPLLHMYGCFLTDVTRDYDRAILCFEREHDLDEESQPGQSAGNQSATGHSATMSGGMSGGRSGGKDIVYNGIDETKLEANRKFRQMLEMRKSAAVATMRASIMGVLAVLAVAAVGTYLFANAEVQQQAKEIEYLEMAGRRMKLCHSAMFLVRLLERAAFDGDGTLFAHRAGLLREEMQSFREAHHSLYSAAQSSTSGLTSIWTSFHSANVRTIRAINRTYTVEWQSNLWDAGNDFVAAGLQLSYAAMEDLRQPFNREVRFIYDNGNGQLPHVLLAAVNEIEEITTNVSHKGFDVASVIVVVALLIIVVLEVFGVRPALRNIMDERKRTLNVFLQIPKGVVEKIEGSIKLDVFDAQEDAQSSMTVARGERAENLVSSEHILSQYLVRHIVAIVLASLVMVAMVVALVVYGMQGRSVDAEMVIAEHRNAATLRLGYLAQDLAFSSLPNASVASFQGIPLDAAEIKKEIQVLIDDVRSNDYLLRFGGEDNQGFDTRHANDQMSLQYDACLYDTCGETTSVGLRSALLDLLTHALRLAIDPAADASYNSTLVADVADLQSGPVLSGLEETTAMLVAERRRAAAFFSSLESILCAVGVIMLPFLYLVVLRKMLGAMRLEAFKTNSMLLLVPPEIIDRVPAVRMFLETNAEMDAMHLQKQAFLDERVLANSILNHHAANPLIIISATGEVISFNQSAEKSFGYSESDVVGKNIKMLMGGSDKRNHDKYLKTYMETGEKKLIGQPRELMGVKKNGQLIPFEVAVDEVILKGGNQAGKRAENRVFAGVLKDITDLNDMRDKLAQEQRFSDAVISASNTGIVVIDSHGIVVRFNEAAEAIFGYQRYEVVDNNISMLMPADIAREHTTFIGNYLRSGTSSILNKNVRRTGLKKNKKEIPLEIVVSEIKIGDTTWFTGYIDDIGERLKLDRVIMEEKAFNEAVVESATSGIVVINSSGIISRLNRAAQTMFGFAAGELKGKNVSLLMPDRFARHHDQYLNNYRDTGIKKIIDTSRQAQGLRKNGIEFDITIGVSEVVVDGQSWFTGFIVDDTEWTMRRAGLEMKQQVAKATAEHAKDGIIVITNKGVVQSFNRSASAMFGYSEEEVVGKNVKLIMPDKIAEAHDDFLEAYAKTGQRKMIGVPRDVQGRHSSGKIVEVKLIVGEVIIGAQTFFSAVCIDQSDMMQTERNVLREEAMTTAGVESLNSAMIVIDAKGTIERFNVAAEAIFGYSLGDAKGQNVSLLMPRRHAAKHDSYLRRLAETGERRIVGAPARVVTGRRRDGSEVPLRLAVTEVRVEDGAWYVGVAHVEDEAKTQALALKRALSYKVVTSAPTAMLVTDQSGTIERANPAVTELLQYSPEEIVGRNVKMLMGEKDASNHDAYMAAYAATGVGKIIGTAGKAVQARRKDGQMVDIVLSLGKSVLGEKNDEQVWYTGFMHDVTGRLKARREQQQRREFDEALLHSAQAAVVVINDVGIILAFNGGAERLLGHTANAVVGGNVARLMPERYAERHDGFLAAYRRSGERRVVGATRAFKALHKDGHEVDVSLSVSEFLVGSSKTFVGVLADRTAVAEATHAANTAAQLATAVIRSSPAGVVVIDAAGEMQAFSPAAERMFGYTQDEAKGKNVSLLMADPDAREHDRYLARYMKEGKGRVVGTEGRLVQAKCKDGNALPVHLSVAKVGEGKSLRFAGVLADKSAQAKAAQELEVQQLHKQAIAGAAPFAIVVIDEKGTVEAFSAAAERMFGFAAREVVGGNVSKLMPAHVAELHDKYLESYLVTGEAAIIGVGRTMQAIKKTGVLFPVHVEVTEVATEDGTRRFVGTLADMTPTAALEADAKLAEIVLNTAEALLSGR